MVSSLGNQTLNSLNQLYSSYGQYEEYVKDSDQPKLVVDMDAGSAILVGPDGKPIPCSQAQIDKILADNGLKLDKKSKALFDTDGFSIEASSVNKAGSIGGAPVLPSVSKGGEAHLSTSSLSAIENCYNRFGDQGMRANALMLLGLLAVLHSAQEDRGSNMNLTTTIHGLKNQIHLVEINAKDLKMQAAVDQAKKAFGDACVSGAISVACAGFSGVGGAVGAIGRAASQIVKLIYTVATRAKQEKNTAGRQEAERIEKEAQIELEVLEEALQVIKNGSSDNKENVKKVMKLLQDVAQRQADSVRVMSM